MDLVEKPCEKVQLRSWCKMPSKLLGVLIFCTKLYIKQTVSLCSFSQFSFPFNFPTANAVVLKFCTLPLRYRFSKSLLAIFDILFPSRVIHRFLPKNWPKLTCGRVFQHNFISKANLKSRQRCFNSHILLAEERKRMFLASLVFNLKAIEFGGFFAFFHLFRDLKVMQRFQKYAKHLIFDKLSDKKSV